MRKVIIALLGASAVFGANSARANAIISDGFVEAGVSTSGTLGSGGNTSPGILYDPSGTGNYGNNDFLTPGDPYEGFYITGSGGYHQQINNDGSNTSFNPSSGLTGVTATGATSTVTATDGSLSVQNSYSLATIGGRSVIAITTSLTNTSGGVLSGLEFLRTLDPDPDVNNYGVYSTNNAIINPTEACATGGFSGQTICIANNGTADPAGAGIGGYPGIYGSWDTTPSDFLSNVDAGPIGDYSIGLAFDIGTLDIGGTTTLDYYYALGADKTVASGGPVPEPLTISLFGAGLAGAAAMRRRRKKA